MVNETSNTLLESLKDNNRDQTAWREFVDSYGPFIRTILVHKGIDRSAADDVAQNVMAVVVRRLPDFERQRAGSFRAWLRAITVNCLRDYNKSQRHVQQSGTFYGLIQSLEDPGSDFTMIWNRQHAEHVLGFLLDSIAGEFNPKTIEAFRRLAILEESTDDVSRKLSMTINACLIARSRVLKRLRQKLRELYGEEAGFFELFT